MKTNTFINILIVVFFSIACLAGMALIEHRTNFVHRLYDDVVLDNKNHYLPCESLPTEGAVRDALAAHQEIIKEIEQINSGNLGVEVDTLTCPGKADLLIWYASHSDRQAIEQILKDYTFFGIPYRLQNR